MTSSSAKKLWAASLAALTVAAAQAAVPLPPVQHRHGIEYLSGGIGQDEARAIEAEASHWPLMLEFAVQDKPRADFAADVVVHLHDTTGRGALETTASGPFLLARLPPGRYAIDATFGGKTLHEQVTVAKGHPAKAVFVWPAGTGEAQDHGARP